MVHTENLSSGYSTVGLISTILYSVRVSLGPESVLVVCALAGLIDLDHPVHDQIIGRCGVGPEDNYRRVGNGRWVLTSDDDEGAYFESAGAVMQDWVQPLTHAT